MSRVKQPAKGQGKNRSKARPADFLFAAAMQEGSLREGEGYLGLALIESHDGKIRGGSCRRSKRPYNRARRKGTSQGEDGLAERAGQLYWTVTHRGSL